MFTGYQATFACGRGKSTYPECIGQAQAQLCISQQYSREVPRCWAILREHRKLEQDLDRRRAQDQTEENLELFAASSRLLNKLKMNQLSRDLTFLSVSVTQDIGERALNDLDDAFRAFEHIPNKPPSSGKDRMIDLSARLRAQYLEVAAMIDPERFQPPSSIYKGTPSPGTGIGAEAQENGEVPPATKLNGDQDSNSTGTDANATRITWPYGDVTRYTCATIEASASFARYEGYEETYLTIIRTPDWQKWGLETDSLGVRPFGADFSAGKIPPDTAYWQLPGYDGSPDPKYLFTVKQFDTLLQEYCLPFVQ